MTLSAAQLYVSFVIARAAGLLVLLLLLLLGAGRATAAPAGSEDRPVARLLVERPDDLAACVEVGALRASVADRIGRDPFRDDAAGTLHVTLAVRASKLTAQIEHIGPTGTRRQREITAAAGDCGGLAETLALSIAIAIDPIAVAAAAASPPQPPDPPPPAAGIRATVRAESKPVARSPRIVLAGGLGLVGTLGAAPDPSVGLTLAVAASRGRLALGIEGRIDRAAGVDAGPGRVAAAPVFAAAVGCFEIRARLCALGGIGRLRGEGTGFGVDRKDSSLLVLFGARVAWPVRAGPVRLIPHLDVLIPAATSDLQVDGATIWSQPAVQGAAGVAVEADFL